MIKRRGSDLRVFLDENLPVFFVQPLEKLMDVRTVDHPNTVKWSGKKDCPLIRDVGTRNYQLFITNDLNQLNDPEETKAIRKSGTHHLTVEASGEGLKRNASLLASLTASLPAVMEEIANAESQLLIRVKKVGITKSTRLEVTDPRKEPPTYWRGQV